MFVDTSGFYSLYNGDQTYHQTAVAHYDAAIRRITTNYVLAEYVALSDARGSSRKDAIDFSLRVLDDGEIDLIWVDEALHRKAVQLLIERDDKTYSLCDSVAFVIMREQGITDALTTDKHFFQEGFVRLLES
ncbi:MAG: type II toxin-antitoxin system VapC family toxin [Pyrinomonadaceae bacterium]|nr:type II toxin-antitoxin system VapC family toxin [Pyrinomonadaceae bacterium]